MKTVYGTGIAECTEAYWSSKGQDVIVEDFEFGTTYMSDKLYAAKRIKNVLIHTLPPEGMAPFPVESNILLLRPTDPIINALEDSSRIDKVPFIRIKDVYAVNDSGPIRIPSTREELAFSKEIPADDKMYIYKMGMESFEDNFKSLSHKTQSMFMTMFNNEAGIKEYLLHFGGNSHYLFPACPFSELSKTLLLSRDRITIKVEKSSEPMGSSEGEGSCTGLKQNNPNPNNSFKGQHLNNKSTKDRFHTSRTSNKDSTTLQDNSQAPSARTSKHTPKGPIHKTGPYNGSGNKQTNKSTRISEGASSTGSNKHKRMNIPTNPCDSAVYYHVILLSVPMGSIPSKSTHNYDNILINVLHVRVYGLLYCYVWSNKPISFDDLRRLGVQHRNILFHCEFTANK
ncbi:hypothetical protein NEPAR06_1583 [Nematocida parisii]|nr:hypothetical protein NEPAR06_1583 [Nematocida parisii]KAI5157954.1 hypothetical protein NEPAR05_1736 [Nematocida parisii]